MLTKLCINSAIGTLALGILLSPLYADMQKNPDRLRKIYGRVAKEDGTPVKGAFVAYGNSTSDVSYKSTETDTDGKYLLEGIDTRDDVVVVQADGFAPEFKRTWTTKDATLDFVLKPGHWMEGRIVDSKGKPIAGVHISVRAESQEMVTCDRLYRYLKPEFTTNVDGKFRLENLPPGQVFIDAYAPGFSQIPRYPLEVDRDSHILTILLRGQISGTVLRAKDNQPVNQFKVFIGFPEKREHGDKCSGFLSEYSSNGVSFNSPDGTFTISDLNTGDVLRVIVDTPGFRREVIDRVLVQSVSNIDYNINIFRIQPAEAFEGLVVGSETGNGIEDALVTILDTGTRGSGWFSWTNPRDNFHPVTVRTDAQGGFRIEGIPIRRGILLFEKKGFARTLMKDVDFYKSLKIVIPKGATIRGNITDDSGKPLGGIKIGTDLEGRISFGHVDTDKDGNFCFTELPPGEYQVRQVEDNKWVRLHDVNLSAGEDYIVDWGRSGEAELEGVVKLQCEPASGIDVRLHQVGKRELVSLGKTDRYGKYHLSVTKAGRYYLSLQKGDWMDPNKIYLRKTVTVEAGKNHFDIILPGASITGRVFNEKTKEPVANIKVRAYLKQSEKEVFGEESWSSRHILPYWFPKNEAKTDTNGRFEMNNMSPGEWLIAQEMERSPRIPGRPFRLAQDERKDIVLKIPDVGSALISAIDANSGNAISDVFLECVNEWGFHFYPEMEDVGKSCSGGQCAMKPKLGPDGKVSFPNLPPERYRVFSFDRFHPCTKTEFKVMPGQETNVVVKLKTGGRVGFRLSETPDDIMPGIPWVGFRISRPGYKKPVLEDDRGPFWGSIIFLEGGPPRQGFFPVKPGEYLLEAALRRENQTGVISSEEDIWKCVKIIKIEQGEETMIDMPWDNK